MKMPQHKPTTSPAPDIEDWSDSKLVTDTHEEFAEFAYWFMRDMFDKKPGEYVTPEEAQVLAAAIQANGQFAAGVIAARTAMKMQRRQQEHEREMQERQHQHEARKD